MTEGYCGLCNAPVLYVQAQDRRGKKGRVNGEILERDAHVLGRWVELPNGRWRELGLPPVGKVGYRKHRCPHPRPHLGRWASEPRDKLVPQPSGYRYRVMWHPPFGTVGDIRLRGSFDDLAEAVRYIADASLEASGVYDNDLQMWVPGL